MKPVAIIPARGGSKRLPRKNILPLLGRPMMGWPIESALKSGVFSDVIVSTEDEEIKKIAANCGAKVIDRPAELASDTAMEIDVYEQVLNALPQKPDMFCAIYATAVLLEPADFQKSFATFGDADAMMSVSEYAIHPFKALEKNKDGFLDMVYPAQCLQRSQTYPHYVASNGTFYWFKTDLYMQHKSYYPPRLMPYVLPSGRAVDIDTPDDLKIAEAFLRVRHGL